MYSSAAGRIARQAALAAFPDGHFVEWSGGKNIGQIIIEIRVSKTWPKPEHWFRSNVQVDAQAVRYRTFQFHGGHWDRFDWNYQTRSGSWMLSDRPPKGALCITPSPHHHQQMPPLPSPGKEIAVFCNHLRGPDGIAKTPQELAFSLQRASHQQQQQILIAFDVKHNDDPKAPKTATQGFFLVQPSWQFFDECILQGTLDRRLRNFYEVIPNNVPVRFYLDFDGDYKEYPEFRNTDKEAIIAQVIECIQNAFQQHYKQLEPLQLRILDSSSDQKLSLHLIGHDTFAWRDTACLKTFVKHIRQAVFQKLLGRDPPEKDRVKLVDLSVYDDNKKFRLLGCTKRSQERYLTIADPYVRLEQTLVCFYDQPLPLIVLGGIAGERKSSGGGDKKKYIPPPCPESNLERYGPLHDFLMPFSVPKGSRHNLRWIRNVSDHLFLVPPGKVDQLPHAMATTMADYTFPFMLHEAPSSSGGDKDALQKLVIDCDGLKLSRGETVHSVIDHIRLTANLPDHVECAIVEAPSRPEDQPGTKRLHLVYQAVLPCAAVSAVINRIAHACPPEWKIDSPTAMRTCGSDKIDEKTGAFAKRVLLHVGGGGGDPFIGAEHTFRKCSIMAGLNGLPRVPLKEGDVKKKKTASASSSWEPPRPDAAVIILKELADKMGEGASISGGIKTNGTALTMTTNVKFCPAANRAHKSNTQKATMYKTHWIQQCWDHDCRGKTIRHDYADAQTMATLFVADPDPLHANHLGAENLGPDVRQRVLSVFPEDEALWPSHMPAWRLGEYFGPEGTGTVDYRIYSGLTLLRRTKADKPRRITGHQAKRLLSGPVTTTTTTDGYQLDPELALVMLDKCDAVINNKITNSPDDGSESLVGCLDVTFCTVRYFAGEEQVFTIRYNVWPPKLKDFTQDPPTEKRVSTDVAQACKTFFKSVKALPLDRLAIALEQRAQWLPLLDSEADFVLDEGDSDLVLPPPLQQGLTTMGLTTMGLTMVGLTITILIAPPGSGKTEALIKSGFGGDIIQNSRALGRNLASRFRDMKDHLLRIPGANDRVRSSEDMCSATDGPLCIVVNSLEKIANRPARPVFVDEITATLTSLAAIEKGGPHVCLHLMRRLRHKSQGQVIVASADATPGLEGRFFREFLSKAASPSSSSVTSALSVTSQMIMSSPAVAPQMLPTMAPQMLPTVAPQMLPTVSPQMLPTVAPQMLPTVAAQMPPAAVTRLRVLYKVYGNNAAAAATTKCHELSTQNEAWAMYVRLLLHNAKVAPGDKARMYMPCSTVADVERAKFLCNKYWPSAGENECVFIHAGTPLPAGFVEDPNSTWTKYTIVCVSPTLKVGVSFTVPHHFSVVLALASSGCGSSDDFLQLMQRVRPAVDLILYFVKVIGGSGKSFPCTTNGRDDANVRALNEFALDAHIDRSVFPSPINDAQRPFEERAHRWLADEVQRRTLLDQAQFCKNVRDKLRRRQITVCLGGMSATEDKLVIVTTGDGAATEIDPLPSENMDLSGPNRDQERIDRILAADEISSDEFRHLSESKRKLSIEEKARIERYEIQHLLYLPNGPLSFDQLVVKHVKENFFKKVRLCALVLGPDPTSDAAWDEVQLRDGHHNPEHRMLQRKLGREFLCTLPDLTPETLLLGNDDDDEIYAITKKRLLKEEEDDDDDNLTPLKRQVTMIQNHSGEGCAVLPKSQSNAKTPEKRLISHVNTLLCKMGLYKLKKKKTKEHHWTLRRATATLVYARVIPLLARPAPAALALASSVVIENPIICYVTRTVTDPVTNTVFQLGPSTNTPADLVFVHISGIPVLADGMSFPDTVSFMIRIDHRNIQELFIAVDPEVFVAPPCYRVTFPRMLQSSVLRSLTFIFRQNPQFDHLIPTPVTTEPRGLENARIRRVKLDQIGNTALYAMKDASEYHHPRMS